MTRMFKDICIECFVISLQWLAGVKDIREEMEAGWAALMLMKNNITKCNAVFVFANHGRSFQNVRLGPQCRARSVV